MKVAERPIVEPVSLPASAVPVVTPVADDPAAAVIDEPAVAVIAEPAPVVVAEPAPVVVEDETVTAPVVDEPARAD